MGFSGMPVDQLFGILDDYSSSPPVLEVVEVEEEEAGD